MAFSKSRFANPLGGGMEAIYTIWEGQTSPQGWQTVELAKPHDKTTRLQQAIHLKPVKIQIALFIDHIATVDQTFSWQVDAPDMKKTPLTISILMATEPSEIRCNTGRCGI